MSCFGNNTRKRAACLSTRLGGFPGCISIFGRCFARSAGFQRAVSQLPACGPSQQSGRLQKGRSCRLEIGDTAGWKPALRAWAASVRAPDDARPTTRSDLGTFPRDPGKTYWHDVPVTTAEAAKLLEKFRARTVSQDQVLQAFQAAPALDLGFAQVDTHRALRKGFPEVIFGAGKTPAQVVRIAAKLLEREQRILVTRITAAHARALRKKFKRAVYHEVARCVTIEKKPAIKRPGFIAVLCAGTSDLPVAEEAAVTAEVMGNRVERICDVGVSGLHRLLSKLELIQSANVIVVVAGMEGA